MGFSEDAVHACGIPIAPMDDAPKNRSAARQTMGIDEASCVVLLMGGGLGLGGIETTLDELESLELSLTLLIVTGHNKKLQARMMERASYSRHDLRVWGYTQEVQMLMRTADVLITKPGALTISEAFCMGLPMLLHEPIPGPETENAIYAEQQGAAIWVHREESLASVLRRILGTSGQLKDMGESASRCGKPEAVRNIVDHIAKL